MKKYDVTALGELLIDFTENGKSGNENYLFEANPGGAPCNVLAMLSKLGKKTAFIGKVGNDFLGKHLKSVIEEVGIDSKNLVLDDKVHTTLAFVHTYADGERDFSFYRNPGADMCLEADEINESVINQSKIFHFGSLSLTHSKVREATKKALETAKTSGCIISFDPNLREPLWNSLDDAYDQISFGMSQCDILKISDNEIQWFTGKKNFDDCVRVIHSMYDIPLILLSMGKDGSRAYYKDIVAEAKTFTKIKPVEKTGAGDTFCACVLNYIIENGLKNLNRNNLNEMLNFANAAATIVTTRKGALRVMPSMAEIQDLLNRS